jgi:serine/threonine-protein kinase
MDEKGHLTDQMPASIGRYKVLEVVGFGAMGAVYRATDPLIKRTLAIKTIRLDIPKQSPQYRSFIERFYQEARISGTLSHPNIVTLFDIAEEGGTPFLAMEFVEGETIGSFIEKGHRFKPERVISLVSQVAAALDYAHSKGIIHRDIKPANLMLSDGDKIKVMDFGIAKAVDAEMTQSGTLLGTPSYMSPEQAMGDKLDGRTDIFSLGVCAFEMLSGEQPFPGNNVTSILYKLVHVDPIEPANLEMNGLVPQKWHDVFGKVLAKKPDERYQTAADFVHDLEFCLGSWFGALDETLVFGAAPASEFDETATLPRMAVPGFEGPTPPPAAPAAAPLAAAEDATTIVMKAPGAEDATLLFAAPPPNAPGDESATVVFKSPPRPVPAARDRAKPAVAEEESPETVALKRPAAPPPHGGEAATILVQAPRAPLPGEEPTVIMAPGAALRAPAIRPETPTMRVAVTEARPVPRPASAPPQTAEYVKPALPDREPTRPALVPGRRGIPAGILLAGAGGLFVVALVVVGILLSRGGTRDEAEVAPPPTAAPATAPPASVAPIAVTGSLHVETEPRGAAVTVNGETQGSSPLDLASVPLGSYEIKVELKGYEPRAERVDLTGEAPRADLKIALVKAAPTTGLADIASTPIGADVSVDGAKVGLTPLAGLRLKPGSHEVLVSREGYEAWSGTLLVQAGERSRIDASLRAQVKATPPPRPPVDTVDTSRVYANTPAEVDTVARKTAGPHVSYPESAPRLKSGASVSVSISYVVNESGEVTEAQVVESAGKVLDETVLGAVRKWRYAPATKKGTSVRVRMTFRQTFRAE